MATSPTYPPPTRHAENLAANLRFVRERRGMTQTELALLCRLPRSTVALLETGDANPTLSVLTQLAEGLGLSLEELTGRPRASCRLYPRGTLPEKPRGQRGEATVRQLLPEPLPGLEIDRLELAAGASFKGAPHRPGTREYLTCERGELSLWVFGEQHVLRPGDVLAFQGDQPHTYRNDGATVAVGFSVVALAGP